MKRLFTMLFLGSAFALGSFAQWGTSAEAPVCEFPDATRGDANEVVASNGCIWSLYVEPFRDAPAAGQETGKFHYAYRVQCFDSKGVAKLPSEGLLVSDYENISYVIYNHYLAADKDGNAIVMVSDCRNSNADSRRMSLTAYKISPEGEMLWGEDGIAVSDPLNPPYLSAGASCVQLEDGSYVFTWNEFPEAKGGTPKVMMQRFSADGTPKWGTYGKNMSGSEQALYPYLVNSGNNTCILVYGKGTSSVIYARKIDFSGEDTWANEARIYRGGWGQSPFYHQLSVAPSGDGGVLVAWSDDRNFSNVEKVYLSYVTSDGHLAFSGASDEAEVKLDYEGYRCFTPVPCAASDGSGFYVAFRVTTQSQNFQGVKIQKVSRDGELLFDDNGIYIMPLDLDDNVNVMHDASGYITIQPADDGGACVFYQRLYSWTDQACLAYRVDKDGQPVWDGGNVLVCPAHIQSSGLGSQVFKTDDFNGWLINYEKGQDSDMTYYMNIVSQDGKVGVRDTGVKSVSEVPEPKATHVDVYSADGCHMGRFGSEARTSGFGLPAGVYVATDGVNTEKILVK